MTSILRWPDPAIALHIYLCQCRRFPLPGGSKRINWQILITLTVSVSFQLFAPGTFCASTKATTPGMASALLESTRTMVALAWLESTKAAWSSSFLSGMSPVYSASPAVCHFASTFSIGWLTGQSDSSVSKFCFPLVRPRCSVISLAPLLTAVDAESPRTWRKNWASGC